jgi:putative hydrolase of HD superfamily
LTELRTANAVNFYNLIARLKSLPRAGWQRCGHENCESVAEHTFGVAALALALSDQAGVDRGKCLALCVVHDLAEAIVGDITPMDHVAPAEKQRRERNAMEQLALALGSRDIIILWEEYEAGDTAEAKLARDLDGIEMALQATAYQASSHLTPADAQQFIDSAERRASTSVGRSMMSFLTRSRE